MASEIKIGDVVRVVKREESYSNYRTFLEIHTPYLLDRFIKGHVLPTEDTNFTVLNIKRHECNGEYLAIITPTNMVEGQVWVIGVEGLEKIESKFKKGDEVEVITNKPVYGSAGIEKGDIGIVNNIIDDRVEVRFKGLNFNWSAKDYELKKVEEPVPNLIVKHDDEIIFEGSYPLDEVKLFETTLTHCGLLPKKELRALVNKYTENPYKYSIGEIIDDLTELL